MVVQKSCCLVFLQLCCMIWVTAQSNFPIKVENKWGLMDQKGRIVLAPQYDAISNFDQYQYATVQDQNHVGLISQEGQLVLPLVFQDIKVLDSLSFAVKNDHGWQVVDAKINLMIPGYYLQVQRLQSFLYLKNEAGWGMAKEDGQWLIPPNYDKIQCLPSGHFLSYDNGLKGVLDPQGRVILEPVYHEILVLKEQLFLVRKNRLWGVLNDQGQEIAPLKFQRFSFLSDHFIQLSDLNQERHLFSIHCSRVIAQANPQQRFLALTNNYVLLRQGQKAGVLNYCGNQTLPIGYDEILWFGNQLFRVKKNNKWGLVSADGVVVLDMEYDFISPLNGPVALLRKNGKYGLLSKLGTVQTNTKFEEIELSINRAKAYLTQAGESSPQMELIKYNDQGEIVSELDFNTHFSIRVGNDGKNTAATEDYSSYIFKDFEWFFDPTSERWGLRNNKDGLQTIAPTFKDIEVLRDLDWTLVGLPKSRTYEWERTSIRMDKVYGIVDNTTGLLLGQLQFRHIYLEDFRNGQELARCILEDGRYSLIDKSGTVLPFSYAYIGPFEDGTARVAVQGYLSAALEPEQPLEKLYDYLLNWKTSFTLTDDTKYDELLLNNGLVYCKEARWSFMDAQGRLISDQLYDYVTDMTNEVAMVNQDDKWGLLGKNGRVLIPCVYDRLSFLENTEHKIVKLYIQKRQYGLIDTLGKLAISATFDQIGRIREGRLAVMRNGKWGFADENGNLRIPCQFDEVQPFFNGLAAVSTNRKWGYINRQGQMIIPLRFREAGDFNNALAYVKEQQSFGYIDSSGQYKIPAQFDKARTFSEGVAIIRKDGLYGLIDAEGNYILKPSFLNISDFNLHGLAIFKTERNGGKQGVVNRLGKIITTQNYDQIEAFQEDLAVVKKNNTYGYINTLGELVIPLKYSKAASFSEGRAAVYKDGQCGFVNTQGQAIGAFDFSRCRSFEDGRAVVYKGMKKAGLLNRDGDLVIEPSIDQLLNFSEGRGLVRDKEYRFYYITEEANVYKGYYEKATEFNNGIAVVKMDDKWGIINRNGITLVRPKYSKITAFEDGYAKVEIDGFNGLSSIDGKMIVAPGFEHISYAGEGLFRVEQGDKVGYFDQGGEWVWELQN